MKRTIRQCVGGWGGSGLACSSIVAILVKSNSARNFERPPTHPALLRQRVQVTWGAIGSAQLSSFIKKGVPFTRGGRAEVSLQRLCDFVEVVEIQTLDDLLKSDVRISLLPISRLNFSFSFVQFCSRNARRFDLDLSSLFDCELKLVETTDSLSTLAPVACMLARLSTNSGRCFQELTRKDPNMVGTMLAAVCLLLLDVPE